jgi:hypothetical protein
MKITLLVQRLELKQSKISSDMERFLSFHIRTF